MIKVQIQPSQQLTRRALSRVDKRTPLALSHGRFLLSGPTGHRFNKNQSRRGKPECGGTIDEMTNTPAAAFRRGHQTSSHGIVMSQPQPEPVNHLLTLGEAAQRLTISRRTLERLIADREFPHPVKINRSSRVLLSDLESYLAKLVQRRATS